MTSIGLGLGHVPLDSFYSMPFDELLKLAKLMPHCVPEEKTCVACALDQIVKDRTTPNTRAHQIVSEHWYSDECGTSAGFEHMVNEIEKAITEAAAKK